MVDSYSQDDTVEIALCHGVRIVQRRFRGFGDQWNFALKNLLITAPWTMKLDPDERLSDRLKEEIQDEIRRHRFDAFIVPIRLFFMNRPLPAKLHLLRLWKSGQARFSDVIANEHAAVNGRIGRLVNDIEHRDSPDLDHWLDKQNRYTTAEAIIAFTKAPLAATPRLFGTEFERRMWLKKHFHRMPFRYVLWFLYDWIWQGAWRAGAVGYMWARLRAERFRLVDYKRREIEITGRLPGKRYYGPGRPDNRVPQYD